MKLNNAYMGNGVTFWIAGTNTTVAHISADRKITLYKGHKIPFEALKEITTVCLEDDRRVSTTQEDKVFKMPPEVITDDFEYIDKLEKVNSEFYNYRGHRYHLSANQKEGRRIFLRVDIKKRK